MTFDKVIPELVAICERSSLAAAAEFCVVRDPRGRVRLAVKFDEAQPAELDSLKAALEAALGRYFVGPIIATGLPGESGKLAKQVIALATVFDTSEIKQAITGEPLRVARAWKKLEARLSKLAWLDEGPVKPPWPLVAQRPRIVTFYSFKGGVGRTTAMAATAWQLAEEGRQVAVLDLDLEAPGVGALLAADSDRGVLDFIVDHLATGAAEIDPVPAAGLGPQAEKVQVYGAGRLSPEYLEKLARLDFTSHAAWSSTGARQSPVSEALQALLKKVATSEPAPEYILIDSRAGLHDLSGLSLHSLAHVDVFLAAAGEQGYRGLDLTLRVAAKRKADFTCVVVHALAPGKGNPEALAEEQEFRGRVYEAFKQFVYSGDEIPGEDSLIDHHSPWVIRRNENLQRFTKIADRREDLFRADYVELKKRIEELTEPEEPEA